MLGWFIGLFAALGLAVLGIICVMEILVLQPDLTDPATIQGDLKPGHKQQKD